MSKRGHGEGTITLRKDGRWEARLSLDGGKRRTFYGKSRREVQQKLNKSRRDLQDGLPIVPERQTVSAYLSPWLEAARPTVRAKTYETYDLNVRRVLPYLGHKKLATLTAADVQACYAALLERGRTRQVKSDQAPKGLSRRSVRQIHEMLHRALKQAAEWGMIARNPADTAKPPRPGREEMKTLSQTQVQQLFTMTAQDRLHALWVLLITTGLRLGEAKRPALAGRRPQGRHAYCAARLTAPAEWRVGFRRAEVGAQPQNRPPSGRDTSRASGSPRSVEPRASDGDFRVGEQ
jgi:integrase